ncbi:MAG: DUF4293 domain-containing protein [Candidatus Azobacteroides sp.]|nr:DUF4293 domain-containing protein [Candidatus Azobacteroides sp.]
MIQRIQTIWLFLIFLLSGCLFFLSPVINGGLELFPFMKYPYIFIQYPYIWFLIGESALTLILSFGAIFLYKKRILQMRLCTGIWILQFLFYITFFLEVRNATETVVVWQWPVIIPLIICILDVLAIRAIKKDEKLVRSLDRLR